MVISQFTIAGTSDKFWNLREFVAFCANNQGRHIHLHIDPEAICLAGLGVYDILDNFRFAGVTIHTRNQFEYHPRYQYEYISNHWLPKKEYIDSSLHTWNQQKIFMCLYGRPTAARLGLASYLNRYHPTTTHVHLSSDLAEDNLCQFELDKLFGYRPDSIRDLGTMISQLPLLLGPKDNYSATNGYDFSDSLTALYRDILIDVIVESHVMGNTFFVTEKTLRAIWLKKPFVVFASRNYLEYLRQMGFRTFADFWDETYDGFETKDRFWRMLDLLDDIANRPASELQRMYWDMQYSLEHNYDVLAQQTYDTRISRID